VQLGVGETQVLMNGDQSLPLRVRVYGTGKRRMNTLFQQRGLAASNIALRHETTSILQSGEVRRIMRVPLPEAGRRIILRRIHEPED
jgi:hypothetical protein